MIMNLFRKKEKKTMVNSSVKTEMEHYPMQKIAAIIGESGCYFLSLCYIAECILGVHVDPIYYFNVFSKQKTDGLYWIESDCYLNFPALALKNILREEIGKHGINFSFNDIKISKSTDLYYYPKSNEYLIGYFEREVTMKTYGHFVNVDENKKVVNDSLGESNTVKYGSLKSLRIIEFV